MVATNNVAAPNQIVGREQPERLSRLASRGGGCFDSRRRVNSTVGALTLASGNTMNNLSDSINEFIASIRRVQARTHAEIGIVAAAIIEEKLAEALLTKMRPLSGEMKKRLFDGYGPLSSFSAKIDFSFALQIIDTNIRSDLTTVRKIRNQFAHSVSLVNFTSPEIVAHFHHFNLPPGESDYQAATCAN